MLSFLRCTQPPHSRPRCILSRICAIKATQKSRGSSVHPTAGTMNYRRSLYIAPAANAVCCASFFHSISSPTCTQLYNSPLGKRWAISRAPIAILYLSALNCRCAWSHADNKRGQTMDPPFSVLGFPRFLFKFLLYSNNKH